MKENYSISEVAGRFNLSVSTLRYYDKENLIPNLQKNSAGVRMFTTENLETVDLIICLKNSGMAIKDIKTFIHWCNLGDQTLKLRLNMFKNLQVSVLKEMAKLQKTLDKINYKCNYYEQAVARGTEKQTECRQSS